MASERNALADEVEQLRQELRDLKDTRPYHKHTCTDPSRHTWVCHSPYCEDVARLETTCPKHGGEKPRGMD